MNTHQSRVLADMSVDAYPRPRDSSDGQSRWYCRVLLAIALLCVGFGLWLAPAELIGQQFRMESQVYSGKGKAPVASTLTLFQDGYVYDFALDPTNPELDLEIVVYDYARRSIVLLDCQREIRLNLEQFEILKMLEEQRLQLSQRDDLKFLVNPAFEEQVDIASGTFELVNPRMAYRATCEKPKDMAAMPIFYDWLDQSTRLAASDPSRLPPFSRLALNQLIKSYSLMPKEIELRLSSEGLLQHDLELKSTHSVIWQLSDLDRRRIDSAKKKLMSYRVVSLGKYRGLDGKTSSREKQNENRGGAKR